MKFTCASGKHFYHSEESADRCALCRRTKDAKVRKVFKRESDELLLAAGIEPLTVDWMGAPADNTRRHKR